MTTTPLADKPRFSNSLAALLDPQAEQDLHVFVAALRTYVQSQRKANGIISTPGNMAAPRLQAWVPVLRNLDKLLHQANAVPKFKPVLGHLAYLVQASLLARHYLVTYQDVSLLPMTGLLLQALSKHLTQAQRQSLRDATYGRAGELTILASLQGSTLSELYSHFIGEVRQVQSTEKQEMTKLLHKVKSVLTPAEWTILRGRIKGVASDVEIDAVS